MKDNCKLKWEEIFANEDSHKEFISKTKIPIQLNIKNTTTQDTKVLAHEGAKHRRAHFLEEDRL